MIKYAPINYPGLSLVDEHTIRKEVHSGTTRTFEFMQALIKHFINHPDPTVVPIRRFDIIRHKLDSRNGNLCNSVYTYDMQRLGPLDSEEKLVIDHLWLRKKHFLSEKVINKNQKLITFISNIIEAKRYGDVHGGNFLRDEDGNFRIIDLEGFINYESLDHPKNQWITR